MVQAHNYKSSLEIEKISLSNLVVLEIIQKEEVISPKCDFIYSSYDIEQEAATINMETLR